MASSLVNVLWFTCMATIVTAFSIAAVGKLRQPGDLVDTIQRLAGVSKYQASAVAAMVVIAELTVAVSILVGGGWARLGHSLATALLLLFAAVLASARRRGVQTSCNCFGTSKEVISYWDVARNIGLASIAIVGVQTSTQAVSLADAPLLDVVIGALVGLAWLIGLLNLKALGKLFFPRTVDAKLERRSIRR